jgi:hypothetical protein
MVLDPLRRCYWMVDSELGEGDFPVVDRAAFDTPFLNGPFQSFHDISYFRSE